MLIVLCDPAGQSARDLEAAWAILDEDERGRAERFVFARGRTDYVVAHGLLRLTLAQCVGRAANALSFSVGAHGRPELTLPGVRFNLSHTDGLVGCAVTAVHDIGFDVEAVRVPAPLEMADRFFSAAERVSLRQRPPREQHEHFYALWTLKESYMKGLGVGLALPLDAYTIVPLPQGEARLTHAGSDGDPVSWTLRHWRLGRHHAALAVRAPAAALSIRFHADQHLASLGELPG